MNNRKVWELVLLAMLACLGLGIASALDEETFAMVFAVEAAWAGVEAIYLTT